MKVREFHIVLYCLLSVILILTLCSWVLLLSWVVSCNVPFFAFVHQSMGWYVPICCFILVFLPGKRWRSLFNWKIWVAPVSAAIIFGLIQWKFNLVCNYDTGLLGYSWQWSAIITWLTLFSLQHYLYSKRGVDDVDAFCLSFYGICLASIFYEVPWHLAAWRLPFSIPKFYVSILMIPVFLCYYRWKPHIVMLPALLLLMIPWLIYWQLPTWAYWIPRLTTFPLFLSLPLGITRDSEKK